MKNPESIAARLTPVLERAVAEARVVGAVVLVAHRGQVVFQGAAGHRDREAGSPIQLDSLFRWASLSKPVISLLALGLIAEGALALHDPVTRFLPDFRPALPDGRVPAISVRQLLTHTSGLGYGFFEPEVTRYRAARISNGLDQPGLSFADNAARLASVPLFDEPGRAFRYSLSTDVLGEVLARATGSTLPELFAERIARPLGLREAGFTGVDRARLAVPYSDGKPPLRMRETHFVDFPGGSVSFAPERAFDAGSYASGGSGLLGTAAEYLTFSEALRTNDPRLLDLASFRSLKQDQLGQALRPTDVPGDGWGFGYGVAVLLDPNAANSPLSRGSYRWEGAYGNTFWVDPVEELSVVALTNTTLEGAFGQFPGELQRATYGLT